MPIPPSPLVGQQLANPSCLYDVVIGSLGGSREVTGRGLDDGFVDDRARGHGVVREEMWRLAMRRMRRRRLVGLIQQPAGGVVHLLADIEAQTSGIARHRLARVVQQRTLEL